MLLKTSTGEEFLVDDADAERVSQYVWYYKDRSSSKGRYLRTRVDGKFVYLHRWLLGLIDSSEHVDHINGDGFDNRRENLRITNAAGNSRNKKTKIQKRGSRKPSKYKGVHWHKQNKKWRAKICVDYKSLSLGCYDNEEAAAQAYDNAAAKYFGEFARQNFSYKKVG